jgi:hypothetical protein
MPPPKPKQATPTATTAAQVAPRRARLAPSMSACIVARLAVTAARMSSVAAELASFSFSAEAEELREIGFLPKGDADTGSGVYIGAWTDPKTRITHYLRHDGPEHIGAIAPTRSGKGVGLVAAAARDRVCRGGTGHPKPNGRAIWETRPPNCPRAKPQPAQQRGA